MVTVPPDQSRSGGPHPEDHSQQPGSQGPYGQQPGPYAQQPERQNPFGPPPGQPESGQAYPPAWSPQYGQVPPPGPVPPFGQMPQPGQQDPYGQQFYGQPPETPKKNRKWWKYGLSGVALVFAVLVTLGTFLSSPSDAEEGDCLHVPEFGNYPDENPETVDCDDDEANIKVAVKHEGHDQACPEGMYRRLEFDDGPALCGMLNADEGDCFTDFALTEEQGPQRVRCDDPSAEVEVVTLAEGSLDVESVCGGGEVTDVRVYAEPETVMCIASPNVT